jgi:8-oxo-dGTP pyrophosphatase MutT (NUDIX family)
MKIKKLALAIILKNKKWLLVRNKGRTIWTSPGGHIDNGETPEESLKRELKEELNFSPSKIKFYTTLKVPTPIEKDTTVELNFFLANTDKDFKIKDSEIEEIMWINSKYKGEKGELIDNLRDLVRPKLLQDGLIE